MKVLFFSDLHGCSNSLQAVENYILSDKPDLIVLLGDVLYHGPRNPLKDDYAPPAVVQCLNKYKDSILAIRGNCDSEVDQMLLEFPIMSDFSQLMVDSQRFFLTHGHLWSPQELPNIPSGAVFCYGHTHIPHLEKLDNGVTVFNPGSVSLPKGGHAPSFGWLENNCIEIRDLGSGRCLNRLIL